MLKKFVYNLYITNFSTKKLKTPVFSSCKYKETFNEFKGIREKNKKEIIFPLRYTSNKFENKSRRFYILLVKEYQTGYKEIIKQDEFLREEKFYVYGVKKRYNVSDLLENVFLKFIDNFTTVRMFKNKIVLQSGEDLECILTKNLSDCKRLYSFLKQALISRKIISFLFLGKVPNVPFHIKVDLIKRLVDMTGLDHHQFKRNSTRH